MQSNQPKNSEQTNLVKVGYSIADVCKILGVCRDTVYREINSGKLKTFKVGARRRFVSKDALKDFVKRCEADTAA